MSNDLDGLQETLKRWTLLLGVLQITVGCVVGFIPPAAVAWFRGIVMAHIELTANGVLMVVLGLLVGHMRLSAGAWKAWFATLQLGTWTDGPCRRSRRRLLGASSPLMPTLNEKFPPPGGTASPVVSGLLMLCGITILAALLLTLAGLLRSGPSQPAETG